MRLSRGLVGVLTHRSPYVVIACGITGVILVQQALKAGALAAPVAVLTAGDPLLSIVLGIVGIAAVVGGVVVLAGQSTALAAGSGKEAAGQQDGMAAGAVHRGRG